MADTAEIPAGLLDAARRGIAASRKAMEQREPSDSDVFHEFKG